MRAFIAFALTLALAFPAMAGELLGVTIPDSTQVADQSLQLNGMALRKVMFIKVYVAGLYLPEKSSDGSAVLAADAPRQTVMHWLRGGGKGRICDGWYEGLEANTPNASAELKGQFDTLCEWMPDAEKGDVFTFTYVPGTGTEVKINDAVKGTLPGKAFADALFAAWIGPHPGPGEEFKKNLLGG